MKKRPKGEYLREIVREVGLGGVPGIEDEIAYLAGKLTTDQLSAVGRLLDRVLAHTHQVRHLPYLQGLHAIRDGAKRGETTGV